MTPVQKPITRIRLEKCKMGWGKVFERFETTTPIKTQQGAVDETQNSIFQGSHQIKKGTKANNHKNPTQSVCFWFFQSDLDRNTNAPNKNQSA